jgi:hypothetical protein
MLRTLLIFFAALTFVLNTSTVLSGVGQDRAGYLSAGELQRDVTFLLLDKNINDITRQLDAEVASSVPALLRRLIIYSRAGQQSRVKTTLEQLSATANWQCPASYDLRWLIWNAGGDSLAARRFYFERLCPDDINAAGEFVRQWASLGDQKELDGWLSKRSDRNDEWLMLRVDLRRKSGTAGEVLDELAAEIKANPADWPRLVRYLNANNHAGNLQDLAWLEDTFEAHHAAEYFRLGDTLRNYSPDSGVRLLRKSLETPFTDADAKLVDYLINRPQSASPSIKVNLEKQLRYWTKRSLAEAYQRTKQALAAQPLVEELVAMKGDDILLQDVHQLAGAVQSQSGHRVVETGILRDETARRGTSEYWLERVNYYDGREEYGLERESYRQALLALAAKPEDSKRSWERFVVVRSFAFFLASWHNEQEDRSELAKLLTNELNGVPAETDYAFRIAVLITQNEFELDALQDSVLAGRPSFVARLFDGRRDWGIEESGLIQDILNHDKVSSSLKGKIWSSLEQLVRDPGSTRAFYLAEAMQGREEWQRAIPLWRGYIEHASPSEEYSLNAIRNLITAYCRTGQWLAAENLLFARKDSCWRDLPKALAEVAIVAAQQNATDDAMRLWRTSTNLDRRNLEALEQLARTKARPQLLAMYSKMKKDDPVSTIPDLALRLLQ